MAIKGFLFDWDGTLVDSQHANYLAYRVAFSSIGKIINEEQYSAVYGLNISSFAKQLFPRISDDEISFVHEVKNREYRKLYGKIKVNESLLHFATQMKNDGYKIGLVSNAGEKNVRPLLDYLNITTLFDLVLCAEDVSDHKPSAEIYLKALGMLSLDVKDVVAFEDSECGITSAKSAGVKVIRVAV